MRWKHADRRIEPVDDERDPKRNGDDLAEADGADINHSGRMFRVIPIYRCRLRIHSCKVPKVK